MHCYQISSTISIFRSKVTLIKNDILIGWWNLVPKPDLCLLVEDWLLCKTIIICPPLFQSHFCTFFYQKTLFYFYFPKWRYKPRMMIKTTNSQIWERRWKVTQNFWRIIFSIIFSKRLIRHWWIIFPFRLLIIRWTICSFLWYLWWRVPLCWVLYAKYAEVDPDFGYHYQMTEPEYVDKAVPYFNIRIMERFFGWMGLVEKKEVILHTLYKVSPLFRKLIDVNRPETRVVITIKHTDSSEVN